MDIETETTVFTRAPGAPVGLEARNIHHHRAFCDFVADEIDRKEAFRLAEHRLLETNAEEQAERKHVSLRLDEERRAIIARIEALDRDLLRLNGAIAWANEFMNA